MLIRSQSVGPLLAMVRARGGDVGELCERFGLSPQAESSLHVEITVAVLKALFDAAARACDDPHLGVHTALALPRGRYGLVEYGALSAPTLGHALERLARFSALINRAVRYELVRGRGAARILQRVPGHADGLGRQANEFNIVALLRMGRAVLQEPWVPKSVWFAHPAPSDVDELVRVLGTAAITFNADGNGMALDAALLDRAVPSADPYLLRLVDQYAEVELATLPREGDFLARAQAQVRHAMRGGTPRLSVVAASLRMSPRTFQRRLEAEGLGFHELVERVRVEVARAHLRNDAVPLAEIAFTLGYSDMGSFMRAFKRWTGMTAGQFRRTLTRA